MDGSAQSPEQLKTALRRATLARRDALPPAERMAAGLAIAERGLPVEVTPGTVVSGFSPLKSEISPLPLAPELFPDILIVPLLAFDRRGHRIGYGAGYYDMTVARLRAMKPVTAIGIAFATQEIAAVPATPRDARLDLVLTERETIDFRT